jgi:hypothetical protein
MAAIRSIFLTGGLLLATLPLTGSPALAQIVSAAHDNAEWNNDRQPPYGGNGWLESEGGSPSVTFPSSGIDIEKGLFVWTFTAPPVPALSTRGLLATAVLIVLAAAAALRSRNRGTLESAPRTYTLS